jgi:hypothetical protein
MYGRSGCAERSLQGVDSGRGALRSIITTQMGLCHSADVSSRRFWPVSFVVSQLVVTKDAGRLSIASRTRIYCTPYLKRKMMRSCPFGDPDSRCGMGCTPPNRGRRKSISNVDRPLLGRLAWPGKGQQRVGCRPTRTTADWPLVLEALFSRDGPVMTRSARPLPCRPVSAHRSKYSGFR